VLPILLTCYMVALECLEPLQERNRSRLLLGIRPRMRVDQIQVEAAVVERTGEASLLPILLARAFGDLPGFELRGESVLATHRCPRVTGGGPVRLNLTPFSGVEDSQIIRLPGSFGHDRHLAVGAQEFLDLGRPCRCVLLADVHERAEVVRLEQDEAQKVGAACLLGAEPAGQEPEAAGEPCLVLSGEPAAVPGWA